MVAHPLIRPAEKADAAALAILVDIAGEGLPAYMWGTMKAPGQSILEFGRSRAGRDEGGFSYRNATVVEIDGEIAAALVGYRLDDPYDVDNLSDIPEMVRPLIELEAEVPGSWYVNVLATFPECRGIGLGTQLLEEAEDRALESGAQTLSIIVASENTIAARLYARTGYEEVARRPVVDFPGCPHGGDWVLMTKPVTQIE